MPLAEHEAATLGPGSPSEVAELFLQGALRGRLRPVWNLLMPSFRREIADGWIEANRRHELLAARDRTELARALAEDRPSDPLWVLFEIAEVMDLAATFWPDVDLRTWGWVSRPRVIGLDRELALLVDAPHGPLERDSEVRAVGFVLELKGGRWQIAEFRRDDMRDITRIEPTST